jgi:hypothetical protein
MTIPCITMSGTRPTFYLVPVTQELSTAVIGGVYPATETTVLNVLPWQHTHVESVRAWRIQNTENSL